MLSFTLFVGCTSTNQVTHIEQADSIIKYKENPDKLGRFSNLYSSKKTYPVTCQENCYQPSKALVCESPAENCRFVGEQFRPEVNTGFTFRWLGHASFYLKSPEGSTLLLDPVSKQFDWPVDWAFRVANGFFRHEPKWLTSSELKDVDAALYSHIHYDHFNKGDIKNIGTKTQYFMFMKITTLRFGAVGLLSNKVNEYFLLVILAIRSISLIFNSVMATWMFA